MIKKLKETAHQTWADVSGYAKAYPGRAVMAAAACALAGILTGLLL